MYKKILLSFSFFMAFFVIFQLYIIIAAQIESKITQIYDVTDDLLGRPWRINVRPPWRNNRPPTSPTPAAGRARALRGPRWTVTRTTAHEPVHTPTTTARQSPSVQAVRPPPTCNTPSRSWVEPTHQSRLAPTSRKYSVRSPR